VSIAKNLCEATKALVVAPAGYGKTHLIAEAVINYENGMQLILTHTHAGVDSIRDKIHRLNPSKTNVRIETIDGFILRFVASYPRISGWSGSLDNVEWGSVRKCGITLFKKDFIKQVIKSTYAGLYVDEYQDCSLEQHAIVLELTSILSVRVLGDQLQGIFNFAGNQIVDWEKDVESNFNTIDELVTPWRWNNAGNSDLGNWLSSVRQNIVNNQPISLSNLPVCVRWVGITSQIDIMKECFSVLSKIKNGETIVIIGTPENPSATHSVASMLRGNYGVVEPLESKDLKGIIQALLSECVYTKAIALLRIAVECFSGISNTVLKQEFEALKKKQLPNRRIPLCLSEPLKAFIDRNDLGSMIALVESFRFVPKSYLYRKELYYETIKILKQALFSGVSLNEALVSVRENTRRMGRKIPKKAIARTVLIKGLEFDHVVVLNADAYDKKNLYVALTRATKTITILSRSNILLGDPPRNMSMRGMQGQVVGQ